MRRSPFQRNITDTLKAQVIGVVLFANALNSNNISVINSSIYEMSSTYSYTKSNDKNTMASTLCAFHNGSINVPDEKNRININAEAFELFGDMRDATVEEQESVNKYVESISRKTGLNFFEI